MPRKKIRGVCATALACTLYCLLLSCNKEAALKNGTYHAASTGQNGPVEVVVTVKGGKVVEARVTSESESDFAKPAAHSIAQEVAKRGSTKGIDALSGATVTSKATLAALDKALAQARGEKLPSSGEASSTVYGGNAMVDVIMNRRSVRSFADKSVDQKTIQAILSAAMSGPSCVNARDWSFIVLTERDLLERAADAVGHTAEPLKGAALGILVCGDLERAFAGAPDYWVIDGAIAGQNAVLCAEGLGLGSVWLGVWPQMERVERLSALFGLPSTVVPHSIIAIGYPTQERVPRESRFEADRVHKNGW